MIGLAGGKHDGIILKDFKNPLVLIKTDYTLSLLDTTRLKAPAGFDLESTYFNVNVNEPRISISNASGDVSVYNEGAIRSFKIPGLTFDQSRMAAAETMMVRSIEGTNGKYRRAIAKVMLSPKETAVKRFMLPVQVDGFFCTDGWMQYDQVHGRILYAYFYRGELLFLDTDLNLLSKIKTIDTVTKAQIKLQQVNVPFGKGRISSTTQASPPKVVNKYFCTSNDRIYLLSGRKADNETEFSYRNNQPVDVYRLKDGKYLYSFYLPEYKGFKPHEMQVDQDNRFLAGVFGIYLVTFRLNP